MLIVLNFFVVSLFGTINHFVYKWFGRKEVLKYFFATDESTFEHMKLVLYPSLLSLIIFLFIYNNYNLIFASAIGACTAILLIPLLFYFIKYVTHKSIGVINVLIFYVSVLVGSFVLNFIYNNCNYNFNFLGIIIYGLLIIFFSYFSIHKIDCFLFDEPKK